MQKKDVSKKIVFSLLFGLILFHLVNNYIILSRNNAPFYDDSAGYISQDYKVYKAIIEHQYLKAYRISAGSHPALYPFFSVPFYFIFKGTAIAPSMTNSIFWIILILSIYGIGANLHSRKAGLLSAAIATCFPHVFSLSRIYLFDFPLLATVTLAIFCLLKTKNFKDRKKSILFGLATGFSASTKPYFIIFLIGPFLLYFYKSFIKENSLRHKKFKNLILAFVASVCFAGVWYLPPHLYSVLGHLTHAWNYPADLALFSYENIFFYIKTLMNVQILPFYFLLFLFSFRTFLIDKDKGLFLFSWILIPFLFFTFAVLNFKDFRFTFPFLPAITLLISLNIFWIKSSIIKKLAIILILTVGFSQFFIISYYPDSKVLHLLSPNFSFNSDSPLSWTFGVPFAYPYDWGINEMKTLIKNSSTPSTKKIDIIEFYTTFSTPLAYILPEDLSIDATIYDLRGDKIDEILVNEYEKLFMMDYIIVPKEEKTTDETFTKENSLLNLFDNTEGIRNIGRVKLPNSITLFVYKIEQKLKTDYKTDMCNDCFISIAWTDEQKDKRLKVDYMIPHNKEKWKIWLHKIYERITNSPVDYGWVKVNKNLNNLDWTNYSSINFKIKGDQNPGKLEFFIKEQDGDVWYFFDDKILRNDNWTSFSIPFESLENPVWAERGDGKKELNNVIEVGFTLTSFETETEKTIFFNLVDGEIFYLE